MSVFTSQIRHKPWLGQVTLLSVIMGGLLALSLKTQDKIRNDKSERRSLYSNDTVTVGVLTQESTDQFKADLHILKKEKQEINDKVLELNIRTEVALTDEIVQILQSEQLV